MCAWDGSAGWTLNAQDGAGPLVRHADFLIDATGRSASPISRLGGGRVVYDRLVGLVALADGQCGADRRTMIEATDGGWWYSVPLPDGRCVAAFMTDADLLPRTAAARAGCWQAQLRSAPHTATRLALAAGAGAPRVISACTSRRLRLAGPGWAAAGEAALCFDPLSQQGVTWALCSGIECARAVTAVLGGRTSALEAYARRVAVVFDRYLRTRAYYYGLERRWTDSAFWSRRHAAGKEPKPPRFAPIAAPE